MSTRCAEARCRRKAMPGMDRCSAHGAAFYLAALPEELRPLYEAAVGAQGLDDEIALLRVLVRKAAEEHPDDPDFRHKYDLLIRAVGMHYRVSKRAERDLEDSILGVLKGLGDALAAP